MREVRGILFGGGWMVWRTVDAGIWIEIVLQMGRGLSRRAPHASCKTGQLE
jgi:hypothetical protein